jgi:hypothetical protein
MMKGNDMSAKNKIMLNEIVAKYFPKYKDSDPFDLNIERMIEKCIAKESGLTWIGDDGLPYDFKEDRSDAKTGCCRINLSKKGYESCSGEIAGVENKVGDLRVVIYNEARRTCDFFLIPHKMIKSFAAWGYGQNEKKMRINFSYSMRNDTYSKGLEVFRKSSFKEICFNRFKVRKST